MANRSEAVKERAMSIEERYEAARQVFEAVRFAVKGGDGSAIGLAQEKAIIKAKINAFELTPEEILFAGLAETPDEFEELLIADFFGGFSRHSPQLRLDRKRGEIFSSSERDEEEESNILCYRHGGPNGIIGIIEPAESEGDGFFIDKPRDNFGESERKPRSKNQHH